MTGNGDVPVTPSPHCCISHHFSTSTSNNRQKIAVIHAADEGDQSFTYADLISAVDFLTSQLRRKIPNSASSSSEPPRIIGVYIPPSVEYIVAVVAVLRFGEAFLPLDPSWPKHRLLSVVDSSNVDLIITSTTPFGYELDSSNLLENNNSNPSFLWFSMAVGEEESVTVPLDSDDGALSDCESEKERLFCYVMYTSGSTGKPKGVCGTEKGVMNRFRWMQEMYPLKGDEVLALEERDREAIENLGFIKKRQEDINVLKKSNKFPHFAKEEQIDYYDDIGYNQYMGLKNSIGSKRDWNCVPPKSGEVSFGSKSDCAKKKEIYKPQHFALGDIVWAKSGRNYPFWSVVVIDPLLQALEAVLRYCIPNAICVMFFGFSKNGTQRDYGWVKQGMIYPFKHFLERFQGQTQLYNSKPSELQMAVEEAVLAENGFIYAAGKATNSDVSRTELQEATDFYEEQAYNAQNQHKRADYYQRQQEQE